MGPVISPPQPKLLNSRVRVIQVDVQQSGECHDRVEPCGITSFGSAKGYEGGQGRACSQGQGAQGEKTERATFHDRALVGWMPSPDIRSLGNEAGKDTGGMEERMRQAAI